jgi:vanillin dehydrogenase
VERARDPGHSRHCGTARRFARAHFLIGQIVNDAGFPPGVVNVISHAAEDAPDIVSPFIAHAAVKRINCTGSTRVGKIVARLAAEHLKPVLLELGGKSPFIVLDDADLDQAVEAAAFGAFLHQGQICMSSDRFVVDEAIADKFAAKLAAKAAALPAGASHRGQGGLHAGASTPLLEAQ